MKALICSNMLTTLYLVVVALVSTTNGAQVDRPVKCFKLKKDQNYVVEDEIMTVYGNGAMCDCFDSLNEFNLSNISKIIIGQNVTKVGSGCFSHFEQVTEITFGE